jgi:peptidoglycan/xylan/chitin deacetylase (PgdA/CDA1 family)
VTFRAGLRAAASTPPAGWAAAVLERFPRPTGAVCAVLTYHRVIDPDATPETYPGLCVRPAELEAQLREIRRHYEVIGLADLLAMRRHGERLPSRSVLLTFDDAYLDFASNAWPILDSMSLPAVVFVPTSFPDRPGLAFWWERLYQLLVLAGPRGLVETPVGRLPVASDRERRTAFRRLRDFAKSADQATVEALLSDLADAIDAPPAQGQVLGWEALRRLATEGVTLAPHSRSHRLLPQLSDDELREELAASRSDLERAIGGVPPAIAYPSGATDTRVRAAAGAAGYEIGFTTQRGVNHLDPPDWLALRRINIGLGSSATLTRTQIAAFAAIGRR